MKRFYSLIILLCISFAVRAQNFNLLDINKSTDAYPQNYQQTIAKNQFAVLDNIVSYFEANDGIHGGELWRSDGTPGGTFMVKDIVPGQGWSNPADIITSGERIFFSANDYMQGPGNELWTSDGTKAGTKKLSGVSSDNSSANPTDLTDVNGTVYFFTDYGSSTGSELWKSDGTNAGTQKIVNFYKSDYGFGNSAQAMENVNGRLFFALFTKNNGFQLWTSDGTKAGTIQLTTINTGNYWGCTPFNLTAVNGLLYFGLDDGTGDRLYVSDGTIAGTQPVKNAADFYLIRNNIPFTVRYNNIFFGINTSDNNGELCKLNATGNKIEVVKFLGYGNDPDNITNVNNTIFFTAWNGSDYSLFKTDGTDAGTVLVKDANPGGTNWYTNFTAAKNKLLYSYFDDTNGFELWESDGTEAGTNIVKDIYPGIYSCSSNNLTYVNGFILFGANDGINGQELWKSDGTAAGTFLLKNINNTATSSSDPFSANGYNTYGLQGIVSPSNQLLFNATNVQYGNDELFTSDGTAAGTHLVKDINTGSDGSYPQYFVNLNSKTYFIAELNGFTRIWQTDGTNAGTSTISVPALDYEPGYIVTMVATSDLLYIETFNSSTYQYEIWRSDGTSDGTYIVQYLSTYYGVNMTPVDDKLFFSYFDTNTYTWELWKTDGSTAGTNLLNNAYSNYYNLVAYNNKLYFAAYDASYNYILGTSNGTQAGTKILKYIYVDNNFKPTVANGKLFFYGDDYHGYGDELWSTNGTAGGTKIVKDINKGPYGSNIYLTAAVAVDTLLYFEAADGITEGLWKSDGTAKGTQLVKNVLPASTFQYPYPMVGINDRLFFVDFYDSLWTSDGTDSGTYSIKDPVLSNLSNIYDLISLGNKIFFTGYTDAAGQELYIGDLSNMNNKPTGNFASVAVLKNNSLIVFPNPTKDILNVTIGTSIKSNAQIFITDASGKTVLNTALTNGSTFMQLNVSHLAQGTYFIKLISADGSVNASGKFVKQ